MSRRRWGLLAAVFLAPIAAGLWDHAVGAQDPAPPRLAVQLTPTGSDADVLERVLNETGYAVGGTLVIDRVIHVRRPPGRVLLADLTLVWEPGGLLVVHGAPLVLVRVRMDCARASGAIFHVTRPGERPVNRYCYAT